MPSSVQVPLLGVPPLSDPFLDHSLTPSRCILLGNTVILSPAAELQSPFQSSIDHQVDALRHVAPTFWCSLQGAGEPPCDRIMLSGYCQLCEQG